MKSNTTSSETFFFIHIAYRQALNQQPRRRNVTGKVEYNFPRHVFLHPPVQLQAEGTDRKS